MHEYDIALKSILTRLTGTVLSQLTGLEIKRWHVIEFPDARTRRVDLLGETADGRLVHIELQSTNDPDMPFRMLEYAIVIYREFRRLPEQIVIYVGGPPLRMPDMFTGPRLNFGCRIVDIRDLNGESLLASTSLEDNVIAILARLADEREAVRRILRQIALSPPAGRAQAIDELMILAGLRKLGNVIEQEIEQMPILDDIMDHEVLGRERKRGIEMGLAKGRQEGERKVVLRLIAKRFGPIPAWAQHRLETLSALDLERLELRLLDALTIEELFR